MSLLADTIAQGHIYAADWLFLIAAILFGLAAIVAATRKPDPSRGAFVPAGLTLVAIAWLIL